MATFKLIEEAITKIRDYLRTNLPAKLTALETEYGDGIVLDEIKNFYLAEIPDYPETPALLVLGSDTNLDVRGQGGVVDARHFVVVAVLVAEQDTETLRKKTYRYIRAVVELLHEGEGGTSLPFPFFMHRLNYSPILARPNMPFIQDVQLEVEIATEEGS